MIERTKREVRIHAWNRDAAMRKDDDKPGGFDSDACQSNYGCTSHSERRLLLRDPLQGIKCSGWGGGGVPPLYRLAVALKPTKDKPLFITGLKGLPQGVVFTENKITLQLSADPKCLNQPLFLIFLLFFFLIFRPGWKIENCT